MKKSKLISLSLIMEGRGLDGAKLTRRHLKLRIHYNPTRRATRSLKGWLRWAAIGK